MIEIKTMSQALTRLLDVERNSPVGYWGERVLSQLRYAWEVVENQGMDKHKAVLDTAQFLLERYEKDGAITADVCRKAEHMLEPLSALAKRYSIVCVSHAHIDMNWMWGWPETVAITLDTFRTILRLMEEYPDFTFSQSQASVYRIVDEYDPELLSRIKSRVKEGRWEVTASTWVEADKNIPNGESMARHLLYARSYLSQLLDIEIDDLNLDFEPDTFGHSANVPEILSRAGVRYYYHCRGYNTKYPDYDLYRWIAPSGASVIVFREPFWYLGAIEPSMALYVPQFCKRCGIDTMMKVYGVGDHGGGPTRRDLERIIDMNSWPVFPEIRFGTFKEFFTCVDSKDLTLPEVRGELNFIFTGCYTSQSRIKMGNRKAEAGLFDAELFSTIAALAAGAPYPRQAYRKAWQNVLFNQFHDITPGSGVIDTREHAMGLYQETMATVQSQKQLSLYKIAENIDTSCLGHESNSLETVSEGAGVGFGVGGFHVSQVSRGKGKTRLFHAFNPSGRERREPVEIVIWDWPGDCGRMMFVGPDNEALEHQILEQGVYYWDHTYTRVLVQATVPAFGYTTLVLEEKDERANDVAFPTHPRSETPDEFVLENSNIRVLLNPQSGALLSLVDKSTGVEYVDKDRNTAVFRHILEDDSKGMTSWRVGRYIQVDELTNKVKMSYAHRGPLYQSIAYAMEFGRSRLKVEVGLRAGSSSLDYTVECDWHEIGRRGESVPQLGFSLAIPYTCRRYKYDIPFGVIERPPMDLDVPANSWALAVREDSCKKSIVLITDSRHGFRNSDQEMSLTLLRSSYDPDPYPEIGIHKMKFCVGLVDHEFNQGLIDDAFNYNHPIEVISVASPVRGSLPAAHSFGRIEQGSVAVSAVKMGEENENMVIRLYETEGEDTDVVISLGKPVRTASLIDVNERPKSGPVDFAGERLSFRMKAHSVQTICVEFV